MIAFIYGTTAELIKLAPLHHRLVSLGSRPLHWSTAQQHDELLEAAQMMDMPTPDVMLARGAGGHSLRTRADAMRWLTRVTATAASSRRDLKSSLRQDGRQPLVLVHGDTMTTVAGALLGRWLGATVGHVEAGLRSHDWRNPFPEEIDRLVVGKIAQLHYAPGVTEVENLSKTRREVINTNGNTIRDSLRLVPVDLDPGLPDLPERFGLVSLHRIELLQDPRFAESLRALQLSSWTMPLVMVYDPVTDEQIEKQELQGLFDDKHFRRIPKLPYFRFVALLRRASFVVTDSGGLQEECADMGTPCLVHRVKTERSDGLGLNVHLSGMNVNVLREFLDDPGPASVREVEVRHSPSDVIVADLVARGMAG